MTTPPGPHAMTAQAGAVAAWVDPDDFPLDANGTCVDLYPNPIGDAYVPLYLAPPAAVSVEALEGLVASVARRATEARSKCLESDYARGRASAFEALQDELTQLIKERSNG